MCLGEFSAFSFLGTQKVNIQISCIFSIPSKERAQEFCRYFGVSNISANITGWRA